MGREDAGSGPTRNATTKRFSRSTAEPTRDDGGDVLEGGGRGGRTLLCKSLVAVRAAMRFGAGVGLFVDGGLAWRAGGAGLATGMSERTHGPGRRRQWGNAKCNNNEVIAEHGGTNKR